ncbi:MAG: hypothetical protein ACRC2T_10350 [Thermoguttaceae bacterium]
MNIPSNPNIENLQEETPQQKKDTKSGSCSSTFGGCCGCGCLFLLLFGLGGPAPLIPFFFPALFTSSGEHLPTAKQFSPEATNYSFYHTFMHRIREFDISEEAFLKMCEKAEYTPVAIETLPDLPHIDHSSQDRNRINYKREVPLNIVRYVYHKDEHKNGCSPWNSAECRIDPSGKTDASCFHRVSKGYYFEHRLSNGGGLYMLYDSENGRCYMQWNHH